VIVQSNSTVKSEYRIFRFVDRLIVLSLAVLLYGLGAWLSQKRGFDQDEFLHLHVAWSIFKGSLPYRDYFDHYTPLFHLLLVPFFHFFKVDTNGADSVAFFLVARKLTWLISGLILLLTFWLAKLWRNAEVGYVAILFLISTEVYWNVALEIRPDPLAVVFLLLYLITIVRAVQRDYGENIRKRMFAWSGLFLALSFLSIQKVVYAFPGLAVGLCWYVLSPCDHKSRWCRLVHLGYQVVGFCIPLIFTVYYFYLNNGLREFIRYNFFFFVGADHFPPLPLLHQVLYQQPFLGVFGSAGLICSLAFVFRWSSSERGGFIIAPAAVSLVVGLFLIPFARSQYYIFFLPLVAVFAATFLLESVAKLVELRGQLTVRRWTGVAALSSVVIVPVLLLIGQSSGSHWPLLLMLGYWLGMLLGGMTLILIRAPTVALVFFLVAMSIGPLNRLWNTLASPGTSPQIDEMRYIIENTAPTDKIMDGYQGSGVFRPQAYFFWYLGYDIRQRLTDNDKQLLLEDLYTRSISPKLILFDDNLRDLSPGITKFFENNYEPAGTGIIWRRKQVDHNLGAATTFRALTSH
jgi:4-amino-4-deoxy-L-arabinose transferase-like glycosyltransferase